MFFILKELAPAWGAMRQIRDITEKQLNEVGTEECTRNQRTVKLVWEKGQCIVR